MHTIFTSKSSELMSEVTRCSHSCTDVEARLLSAESYVGCKTKQKSLLPSESKMALAAIVVSVACLLVVLGCCYWLMVFGINTSMSAVAAAKEEVCLPCMQVTPDPLDESRPPVLSGLDVRRDDESDEEICCARTPSQFAALFKLILMRQREIRKFADILTFSNASERSLNASSAHLLYKPALNINSNNEVAFIQQWRSPNENPFSHLRGDLYFKDNAIYVLTPGLYFVYCQILYNRADTALTEDPQIVSNYVMRNSIAYPATSGILLKSRHTRNSREMDRHSNYVGGSFFLQAGDQLFVKVSKPSLISFDEMGSFFGLFRVDR